MSIIAISGKMQSGKNTVASIIHYLTHEYEIHGQITQSFNDFTKLKYDNSAFKWKQVAFADKLKDIVCLLIGCTREQLEDAEFKNKELGEEWVQYGYADGFDFQYRNGNESRIMNVILCDKEKYKQERAINWQTTYKNELTPRLLLRLIETNLFRDKLLPNIWVNALMNEYKGEKDLGENIGTPRKLPLIYPNWIITDVRFPNEFDAIKERKGVVIRVNRITKFQYDNLNDMISDTIKEQHPSEIALDNHTFDYTIDNNGSIEELIEKVREILIKINVI